MPIKFVKQFKSFYNTVFTISVGQILNKVGYWTLINSLSYYY